MSSFGKIRKEYKRLRQRGLTLIEAAVVLGLASLVIAGVMVFYQSASVGAKTTEALGELASLQQAIRTVYSGQPTYDGLSAEALAATRSIPGKMVVGTGPSTTLRHAFNGQVSVQAETIAGGTANNGFSIQFEGLPSEACSRMATMDLGTGLFNMQINGGANHTSAVDPVTAANQCGNDNQAVLLWRFF